MSDDIGPTDQDKSSSDELVIDSDGGKDAVTAAKAEIESLVQEREDLQGKYLRAVAEFENVRKRMRAEHAQRMQYANERLIQDLLPVLDNLERALKSHPTTDHESLRAGVELTARMFLDALSRFGVSPVSAVGERFDPSRHEAVDQVQTEDAEEGTIVDELQRGYQLHDRVIRPSRVRVAMNPKSITHQRDA